MMLVAQALACSNELAGRLWRPVTEVGRKFARHVAIGDPQTDLPRVFAVLARHDLLDPSGMLRADVRLISIGDHFDWKGDLAQVAEDGYRFLRWLAAHPRDQVTILAGNHDLSRVTELWRETDAHFAEARALAEQLAAGDDPALAAQFAADFPDLPTPEVARRDYSAFTEHQRELVQALLLAGRFDLACTAKLGDRELLVTHAGVTDRELGLLGALAERDPKTIARHLDHHLTAAVDAVRPAWTKGQHARLVLEPIHVAGTTGQEGGGLLYHRPSVRPDPSEAPRRFDPHRLPLGLAQVCGHAGHHKCRSDLGDWVTPAARAVDRGGLRTLKTDGTQVTYDMGIQPANPDEAVLYMIDAEMNSVDPATYPILELAG